MASKRATVQCQYCPWSGVTRSELLQKHKTCRKCITERNIPHLQRSREKINWSATSERWLQELFYTQVLDNGITCLGMGKLEFANQEKQTRSGRLGRLKSKSGKEFDLLLRDPLNRKQFICVELKRLATEEAIAQVLTYRSEMHEDAPTYPIPKMILIYTDKNQTFLRSWSNIKKDGMLALRLVIRGGSFKLIKETA